MNLIDFQKKIARSNEPICQILEKINSKKITIFKLFFFLKKLKNLVTNYGLTLKEWKILRNRLIKTYLFLNFIQKKNDIPYLLLENQLPSNVFNELRQYILKNDALKNGVTRKKIKIVSNSLLADWIKKNYLKEAKKRFAGVFSYSAHIRYVSNNGSANSWDERFLTKHANFHWDRDLNSFTLIIYLSDVKINDGPFKIIKSSTFYPQNFYLSAYDAFISDIRGFNGHIMSDRAGRYIDKLSDDEILCFTRPKGTALIFDGRNILHDGGLPEIGGHRQAIFIDARNVYMGFLRRILG